ncbi:MAG: hypothetical protein ACI9DJ_002357 [Algoriphagus sp.]|jgi:hypothetical protein
MNPASIFSFGNSFVLLGWLLLFIVPNWKHTQTLVLNGIILVLAILYSFMILKDIGNFEMDSFSSLVNVKALFAQDGAVAAGWLHYLAFDLFVGAYVVRRSKQLNISRLIYSLILPFTFMFGPLGYLLFVIAKAIKTKSIHETA